MMRVELDPNGAFNVTEFGTVKDPDAVQGAVCLFALSSRGERHALSGCADADGRNRRPRQSAALAQDSPRALQAATSSDHPILLRTNKTSGHGIGSSLDERIAEQTDELSFLYDQLGMHYPPADTKARRDTKSSAP